MSAGLRRAPMPTSAPWRQTLRASPSSCPARRGRPRPRRRAARRRAPRAPARAGRGEKRRTQLKHLQYRAAVSSSLPLTAARGAALADRCFTPRTSAPASAPPAAVLRQSAAPRLASSVHETTCRGRRAWAREVAKMCVRRTAEHPPAKKHKLLARRLPRESAPSRRPRPPYTTAPRRAAAPASKPAGWRNGWARVLEAAEQAARAIAAPRAAREGAHAKQRSRVAPRVGRRAAAPKHEHAPRAKHACCGAHRLRSVAPSGRGAREKEEVVNERRWLREGRRPNSHAPN